MSVYESAQEASKPVADDYLDPEDGFYHCGVCGEPKQAWWDFLGRQIVRPRMCRCRREAEAEKQEYQNDQRRSLMRDDCFSEPSFAQNRFDKDSYPDSELGISSRNYVDNFAHFYKTGRGLIFTGTVGTGKTFYSACIANALIDRMHTVKMTSISQCVGDILANRLSENEYIDYLRKYDLVIFDDLGVERNTPVMNEKLYRIINARYSSQKPMIITTNITMNELKRIDGVGVDCTRVYDRILAACLPIGCDGDNVRRQQAREAYIADMKILRGERNDTDLPDG